jgi:hypothetical protein
MNALVLQLGALRPGLALPDVEWLVDHDWTVTLVVSRLPDGAQLPAAVRVLEVGDLEEISAIVRGERFFVLTLPTALARRVRSVVLRLAAVRRLGRLLRPAVKAVNAAQTFQLRVSLGLHRRWAAGPYRVIRSLLWWRLLRRTLLADLLATPYDLVVCGDRDAVPTGWHLARDHPQLEVTYGVNRVLPVGVSVPARVSA